MFYNSFNDYCKLKDTDLSDGSRLPLEIVSPVMLGVQNIEISAKAGYEIGSLFGFNG